MTILSRAIPLLLAAVFLIAADKPPAADIVAQRGDVRMTGAELKDTLQSADPAARAQVTATPQSLANFVRERVLNMAVLAEAEGKKWDSQPEIARRIHEARDAVILQTYLASLVPPDPAYPSEADVATAYETNKARLVLPRQFHIAQIVLTVKPDATPQEEEAVHKKALELRAQAVRPKADFADLARKFSGGAERAKRRCGLAARTRHDVYCAGTRSGHDRRQCQPTAARARRLAYPEAAGDQAGGPGVVAGCEGTDRAGAASGAGATIDAWLSGRDAKG